MRFVSFVRRHPYASGTVFGLIITGIAALFHQEQVMYAGIGIALSPMFIAFALGMGETLGGGPLPPQR